MELLGSSREHTFYGPSKGPRFGAQIQGPECGPRIETKIWSLIMGPFMGPRIEGLHSAGGSTQVHEEPHRDHGHVLHKVPFFKKISYKVLFSVQT